MRNVFDGGIAILSFVKSPVFSEAGESQEQSFDFSTAAGTYRTC